MRILITGGAGFIGCNLAQRRLARGDTVTIYDNLSRPGTTSNLDWLRTIAHRSAGSLEFIQADVRDATAIASAAQSVEAIFHLAGQVAVTHSVQHPRLDFEINAWVRLMC